MAKINFGGTEESVVTREEFPLEQAREVLRNETIAVLGYGVQGPGQALNLRDNGFNVIVGQRKDSKTWEKAVNDGWVPGETLFELEEACDRGTILQFLLSDAGQIAAWPMVKSHLKPGKTLYFSHGFGVTFKERTGIIPPTDVDVILVAPKGSGTSLRRMFLEGKGLNSSFAVFQDATGKAREKVIALGIGVGSGYLFETDFKKEVYSDLTGERGTLMGALAGILEARVAVPDDLFYLAPVYHRAHRNFVHRDFLKNSFFFGVKRGSQYIYLFSNLFYQFFDLGKGSFNNNRIAVHIFYF